MSNTENPFSALDEVPVSALAACLGKESPKVAGTVLGFLPRARAAQVLAGMCEEHRRAAAREIAGAKSISRPVLETIADTILNRVGIESAPRSALSPSSPAPSSLPQTPAIAMPPAAREEPEDAQRRAALSKALSLAEQKGRGSGKRATGSKAIPIDGVALAAEILRQGTAELRTLVAQEEPSLFAKLRQRMFVFNDLESTSDGTLAALFQEVDPETTALSLRFASAELQQRALRGMSQRKADMIRDEIERTAQERVRVKDIESAQNRVIQLAIQMQEKGLLLIDPNDPDLLGA